MKVVLDSNVVIAAFAAQGLCHLVMESVLARHELILSPALLQEILSNLKSKLKLPEGRVREIGVFLKNNADIAKDRPISGLVCRDEDDLKVLALAVNECADVIVSGDQDLLVLKELGSVAIVSPRDFWNMLRATD
jgi:putative PIN family toxin of toxin-antitoxin system